MNDKELIEMGIEMLKVRSRQIAKQAAKAEKKFARKQTKIQNKLDELIGRRTDLEALEAMEDTVNER